MEEKIENAFIFKGTHYKIQLSINQASAFSILLIDEDSIERWRGVFNGNAILQLTEKVGNVKKVSIFYKMLQNAILNKSEEVTYNILTPNDIESLKSRSQSDVSQSQDSQLNNNVIYYVLIQTNQYDNINYPLSLKKEPFSHEELKAMIRSLQNENGKLVNSDQSSLQKERVQALEQQIYALNQSIRKLADEKDQVIVALRHQINDLEEQTRSRPKVPKTIRNDYSRNQSGTAKPRASQRTNLSSGIKNNSNSRNFSNVSKKKSLASNTNSNTRISSINLRNSKISSASSSARGSRKNSAINSASGSRRSSAAGSARSSASNSRKNSATNSRPSSRCSSGSFKRFDPTEWVKTKQSGGSSRNSSRGSSRNQSPANVHRPAKKFTSKGVTPTDTHLNRLHNLVQNRYKKI